MLVRKSLIIIYELALMIALAACTPAATTVEETAAPSPIPTSSETATVGAAATPDATSTPRPTDTPIPISTDIPIPTITLPYTQLVPEEAIARIGIGSINDIALSPDGRYLAVGTSIGTYLYRMGTFEEVWSTNLSTDFLVFSSNNRFLAGTSYQGDVFLWEAESAALVQTFVPDNRNGLDRIAFSPNSNRLAYGSGNSIIIWNIQSGNVETSLIGHTGEVTSAVFITDDLLATGAWDTRVVLWDLNSGQVVRTIEDHEGEIYSLAVSPDGQTLVSSSDEQTILWDALTGDKLYTIDDLFLRPTFSSDGALLTAYNGDSIVHIWDVNNNQLFSRIDTLTSVRRVFFSLDGYLFVANRQTSAIHKVDPATGETVLRLEGFAGKVGSTVFSSDGSQLLIAGSGLGEASITLTNLDSGEVIFKQTGFTEKLIFDADISPDRSLIAAGVYGSEGVYVWETSTGELIDTFTGSWSHVEFSPDGRWLAFNSALSTVTIWDVASWQPVLDLIGPTGDLVFLPDGTTLAAVDDDSVVLYELPDGDVLQEFKGLGFILSVAFSPDGTRLAVGLDDGTVVLWDVTSNRLIYELDGHEQQVRGLDFSPSGELLASGSFDDTAILWNVKTGQPVETLSGHSNSVTSVEFSPDGTLLATGSSDGTVILWPVE